MASFGNYDWKNTGNLRNIPSTQERFGGGDSFQSSDHPSSIWNSSYESTGATQSIWNKFPGEDDDIFGSRGTGGYGSEVGGGLNYGERGNDFESARGGGYEHLGNNFDSGRRGKNVRGSGYESVRGGGYESVRGGGYESARGGGYESVRGGGYESARGGGYESGRGLNERGGRGGFEHLGGNFESGRREEKDYGNARRGGYEVGGLNKHAWGCGFEHLGGNFESGRREEKDYGNARRGGYEVGGLNKHAWGCGYGHSRGSFEGAKRGNYKQAGGLNEHGRGRGYDRLRDDFGSARGGGGGGGFQQYSQIYGSGGYQPATIPLNPGRGLLDLPRGGFNGSGSRNQFYGKKPTDFDLKEGDSLGVQIQKLRNKRLMEEADIGTFLKTAQETRKVKSQNRFKSQKRKK